MGFVLTSLTNDEFCKYVDRDHPVVDEACRRLEETADSAEYIAQLEHEADDFEDKERDLEEKIAAQGAMLEKLRKKDTAEVVPLHKGGECCGKCQGEQRT